MTQASIKRRLERLDSGEAVGAGHAYVIELPEGQDKDAALTQLGIRPTGDDIVVYLSTFCPGRAALVRAYHRTGARWLPLEE